MICLFGTVMKYGNYYNLSYIQLTDTQNVQIWNHLHCRNPKLPTVAIDQISKSQIAKKKPIDNAF